MIHRVFHEAKENAPAIIFIDDSDVIFESGQEHGLYRYLLTMLDGLESKRGARLCGDDRHGRGQPTAGPDPFGPRRALARDEPARRVGSPAILGQLVESCRRVAPDRPGAAYRAADGFTGADLKRVIDDGKALYAFDRATAQPLKSITDYFLAAIETVRANKCEYAQAEARARANRPPRPPWFDVSQNMMAFHADETD